MRFVKLTNTKKRAIVSNEDYEKVAGFPWYLSSRGYVQYGDRSSGKLRIVTMHIVIFSCPAGMVRDHKNHRGWDNRRDNIRVVSVAQNIMNSRAWKKRKTSRFKGVSWHRASRKWMAYLKISRKRVYLGLFKKEREAAVAYNRQAEISFGPNAFLNAV